MFTSVFMTEQDAAASSNTLFALGREPEGDPGTTLLALDIFPPNEFTSTSIGFTADAFYSGIDFQPGTGTLYASSGGNGAINPQSLFTMNPSDGVATLVGGFSVDASIFIQDIGILYGNENEQLYTIDPSTGLATATDGAFADGPDFVGDADTASMNALAVDPTTNILYGVSWNDSELFTIDTSTGAATSVGVFGALETEIGATDLSGLAFDSTGALYVSTKSLCPRHNRSHPIHVYRQCWCRRLRVWLGISASGCRSDRRLRFGWGCRWGRFPRMATGAWNHLGRVRLSQLAK